MFNFFHFVLCHLSVFVSHKGEENASIVLTHRKRRDKISQFWFCFFLGLWFG